MPQTICFECEVLGKPQPAGSKRGFVNPRTGGVIITDAAKGSKPWKQEIGGAAREAWHGEPLTGAVSVLLEFYFARPKGHYGTGRNAGVVKDSAPRLPASKPDVDKIVRSVFDALTGIVYRDDAQIAYLVAAKFYGEPERVKIRVYG